MQNQYLDFLIDPIFQGVNKLFILFLENEEDRKVHTGFYLRKVEIKEYNVINDGPNFFDQPVKSGIRTYDNTPKNAKGQGDDYTIGCLLESNYYNIIAIDLSKQQALDSDPKAIQKNNFTGNLDLAARATISPGSHKFLFNNLRQG